MRHVHVEPVEDDLRVLVLAIKLIAASNFDGVHYAGFLSPLIVHSKKFYLRTSSAFNNSLKRAQKKVRTILLFPSLSFLFS